MTSKRYFKFKDLKQGSVLVVATIFVAIGSIASANFLATISSSSRMAALNVQVIKAGYNAEAGINRFIYEINQDNSITSVDDTSFNSGSYSATVSNDTITANGIMGNMSKSLQVDIMVSGSIPPGVYGAITAAGSVNTTGNITVDGRDHDLNGNLTGDPGSWGITTGGIYTQSGASTVGGNGEAPGSPGTAGIDYQENVTDVQTSPPWEVLGIASEAELIALADNYYTGGATPAGPLSGITYVKLDDNGSGSSWLPATIDGEGVLVVHNDDYDALMKNVHGTFKGIIVSDDMSHINGTTTIIGAVVTTGTSGNALGNGAANVLYSKEAIGDTSDSLGNPASWTKTYAVSTGSWKEA
ncbi:hypothetical protein ACFLQ1_02815 [Candidatus Auribacterota bacterium]